MTQRDPETYALIGAAMEVHRELGHGFLEAVFQDAFEIELDLRGIPYQREVDLPVTYKGRVLKSTYRADFICYGDVIVEMKALSELTPSHTAQVLNYLKATGYQRGMLFNFGTPSLHYKRLIHSFRESDLEHDAESLLSN
jgi:GxxExxY protein